MKTQLKPRREHPAGIRIRFKYTYNPVGTGQWTWSRSGSTSVTCVPVLIRIRETGEAQLAIVGKGDKPRNILIPADLAAALRELRGDASASARVFPITERRINYIVKSTAKRAGINLAVSAHWLRHAHASHAIDEGAPIALVSQTLGHADLKTTTPAPGPTTVRAGI